jgi:hypothetical protein
VPNSVAHYDPMAPAVRQLSLADMTANAGGCSPDRLKWRATGMAELQHSERFVKEERTSEVRQAPMIRRDLHIGGDLSFAWYPNPRLDYHAILENSPRAC